MNLKYLCEQSQAIVLEAGEYLRAQKGKVASTAIEEKERNSLVSYVDRTAEELLVKGLGALLPEATFLTEEGTVEQKDSALQWIIDPLDGTTNFLHQIPTFSVSVALRQNDAIVLGIVYEVNRDECFYAWKGGGAYLNGQAIKVSSNPELGNALLATGFPYHNHERAESYFKVLREFTRTARGMRRIGSAAVDMAYVACGRFDAYYEYSINAWDIAAGIILVQEAGGTCTDFKGGDNYLFGKEIIAASAGVHPAILKTVKKHFSV